VSVCLVNAFFSFYQIAVLTLSYYFGFRWASPLLDCLCFLFVVFLNDCWDFWSAQSMEPTENMNEIKEAKTNC